MEKCEFCGAPLEIGADFCGECGHVPPKAAAQATGISDLPPGFSGGDTVAQVDFPDPGALPDPNEVTLLSPLSTFPLQGNDELTFQSKYTPAFPPAQEHASLAETPTEPLPALKPQASEEEEEERRRRAALVGLSVPLLSGLAQPPANNVPLLTGTPQVGQVPLLAGTPQLGQVGSGVAAGNPAFAAGSGVPQSTPYMPGAGSPAPVLPGKPAPGSGSHGPATGGAPGCVLALIITLTALFLLLTSVITLGLTAWAPNLALNGSATVSPGGTMTLHGSSFLPNSSVELTLDSSVPIYYLQRSAPIQLADSSLLNASQLFQLSAQGTNTFTVPGNGTFTLSFVVNPAWSAGPHTVTAYETLTHRHASVNFTITGVATTATATVTPSPTPTNPPTVPPTAIPSPSPTSTPTPTAVVPTPTPTHIAIPTPKPTSKPTPSPTPTPLPGRLSASPQRINGNTACSVVKTNFVCAITLTNSSRLTSLSWSAAFSNATKAPSIEASSHTIKAASSETVTLLVPTTDERNTITITFTGPANSVNVTWYYQIVIQ